MAFPFLRDVLASLYEAGQVGPSATGRAMPAPGFTTGHDPFNRIVPASFLVRRPP
jgi:hypothetical protein